MTTSAAPSAPINVLLVDDHEENLLALEVILETPGVELIKAASGAQALRWLLRQDFAVILLDVSMPGMDGFEVARLVKQRERTRHVPIIFLTAAHKDIESVYRGYEVGAVDYIQKPLDPDVVRAKVSVLVELYRRGEEIKRQAELLREAQLSELRGLTDRRYRSLADAVPHLVSTAAPTGEVVYTNQRWTELTGIAAPGLLGAGWRDAIHPDDRARFVARWEHAVAATEPLRVECRVRTADGAHRWHLCQAIPERDRDGRLAGWLSTFTDVNEQKQLEEEREALLRRAEEAVRIRDEFLSIASHELRTPLAALELQVQSIQKQLVKQPSDLDRLSTKSASAKRQVDRLARLISEMLDVSRIEAGRLELDREAFDLGEIVREVVSRFSGEIEQSGSPVELDLAPSLIGSWDRLRLDQVVTNLLHNALKYGHGKPIRISTAAVGSGADAAAVLTVEDQGIGIPAADQRRIFGRFERAVSSRSYGGMGVGLFIVDRILTTHGGAIDVRSAPGEGATFTVRLPLAAPPS